MVALAKSTNELLPSLHALICVNCVVLYSECCKFVHCARNMISFIHVGCLWSNMYQKIAHIYILTLAIAPEGCSIDIYLKSSSGFTRATYALRLVQKAVRCARLLMFV